MIPSCFLVYRISLLIVLLMSIGISVASYELSGRWDVMYENQIDEPPAIMGVIYITKAGSTFHGDSIQGARGDGKLIGLTKGRALNATITFRKKPAMFIKLDGCRVGDTIQGSFTATASDGGFYRGRFIARRSDSSDDMVGVDPVAPEDPLAYHKTLYFDPDLYWHNFQFGKAKMDTYVINYSRNSILMVGNKPFLWQWWL